MLLRTTWSARHATAVRYWLGRVALFAGMCTLGALMGSLFLIAAPATLAELGYVSVGMLHAGDILTRG
jgi:hypothetical protein